MLGELLVYVRIPTLHRVSSRPVDNFSGRPHLGHTVGTKMLGLGMRASYVKASSS